MLHKWLLLTTELRQRHQADAETGTAAAGKMKGKGKNGGEWNGAEKYVSNGKAVKGNCWKTRLKADWWRRLCGSAVTRILEEPAGLGGWRQGTQRDHSSEIQGLEHWFGSLFPWKSLTYKRRESGKPKTGKSLKCVMSFSCDAHL